MEEFNKHRRSFIKKSSLVGASLGVSPLIFGQNSADSSNSQTVVIMHTNDVHSHIHPFEKEHYKYPDQGGVIRRAFVIDQLRKKYKHTLLLDAGDIFQGTPFFNFYGGELEMKLMTKLKYDAATIGNHDFDGGIDGLIKAKKHGKFDFLISNYLFENDLEKITSPFQVFKKGRIKIGVFGIGIELKGLVDPDLCKGVIYTDPVVAANTQAKYLKNYLDCDYVICLSHLGLSYEGDRISDLKLAKQTENIDLIIGGHTHSFLSEPIAEINSSGKEVLVTQAGWAGLRLGVVKITFNNSKKLIEPKSIDI